MEENLHYPIFESRERDFTATFEPVQGKENVVIVPSDYGLETLDVIVTVVEDDLGISFGGILFTTPEGEVQLQFQRGRPPEEYSYYGSVFLWKNLSGSLNRVLIKVRRENSNKTLSYLISNKVDARGVTYVVTLQKGQVGQIPVFSVPGSLPRIDGFASLTQDGKMICELEYNIIKINNNKNYKLYNLNFLDETKGNKNETIPEAVKYLSQFQTVDQTTFIGYAITRLILSQELFGKFETKYLLQRYYSRFLSSLQNSIWKDFYPFFVDYDNYHLLFR